MDGEIDCMVDIIWRRRHRVGLMMRDRSLDGSDRGRFGGGLKKRSVGLMRQLRAIFSWDRL